MRVYKINDLNSFVEIALNFNVDYNPADGIDKINDDLPSDANFTANTILGEDYIETKYHPLDENRPSGESETIEDYENVQDSFNQPIVLYNWKTKQSKGFPFLEGHDYNIGSDMFTITLKEPDLEIKYEAEPLKYKPILLIEEQQES